MTKPHDLVVSGALLLSACATPPRHEPRNPTVDKVNIQTVDLLGPKPQLAAPTPYRAPKPTIYKTAEGLEVWLVERPESQRVPQSDRSRSHRENVTENPANTCCGPLIRFDVRRMVVPLDS